MIATAPKSERESQRQLMARKRAAERDLRIPAVKDPARRAACEADDCEWLRVYVPRVFSMPFTSDQRGIVEGIGNCLEFGLTKCYAAPRHDGKTSIARYLTLKYALQKVELGGRLVPRVPLSLLISATGPKSTKSLAAMKQKLRALPGSPLFDDYPLECTIAHYVGTAPAKCNNVTVQGGKRIKVEWGADHVILPSLEEDDCFGGMLAAMGITSNEIQGFNLYDVRPRMCVLDDLDDRDSLASKGGGTVAEKIETNIDENVAGLGGPGEALGLVMLCTVPSIHSIAYRYSDPTQKPAWSGVRLQKIKKWPARADLWETYVNKRQHGKQAVENGKVVDVFGRDAHAFYLENRVAMDEGSDVSNQADFVQKLLPDGSQSQVSALQNCYDYIADKGLQSFLTEYQNDPPLESGPEGSGITAALVASRVHGYPQATVPNSPHSLVMAVDVGKHRLHWGAVVWDSTAAGFVIDYDTKKVLGTSPEDTVQLTEEQAILQSLVELRSLWAEHPYCTEGGEVIAPKLVFIDSGSGLHQSAVYQFCRQMGRPFVAAKGFARGHGSSPFHPGKQSRTRQVGDNWAIARQQRTKERPFEIDLHEFDSDHYKRFAHQRFLTPTLDADGNYRRGGLSLWTSALSHRHADFARHVAAEIWVEQFEQGKGLKAYWDRVHRDNHYLDVMAMCCAAGNIAGVRVVGESAQVARRKPAVLGGGGLRPDGRSWV